jgi:hypothetical protein
MHFNTNGAPSCRKATKGNVQFAALTTARINESQTFKALLGAVKLTGMIILVVCLHVSANTNALPLKLTQNDLDKAVVKAYYNTTQRFNIPDIGSVTTEEIERHPVLNPFPALQGRVDGIHLTRLISKSSKS